MGAELDAALLAARRGDSEGVTALWRALNPPLERYLAALVGQAAQDVASETWLQAARDVPGFRGDAHGFRVWLFRIARNRAVDEQRLEGRRREEPLGMRGDSGGAAPDAATVAEERLGTDRAMALIARLPKEQAEAVLLRSVAGLDARACGAILGKRPGAVRIAAMRGLRGLAAILEQEQEPETTQLSQAGRAPSRGAVSEVRE
ncbi:RNA polymerase sigma factor [Actinospica sp.]|uniref:RNA polymerase sigma factor n=1 Tax=Actinospica sp. TaxID=1872142 RepID=UPI002CA31FB0|nr:RNA polymerase sigma factor [Actinospica sp.]HWG23376.1 RNA polymerase sigma factor [Actinospica sp.]